MCALAGALLLSALGGAPPDAALFGGAECGLVGAADHWAPLAARLAAGLPVSVIALGSSLVGVHGGCTAPAPIFNSSACRALCPRCCGSRCGHWGDRGWARALVDWLNEAFPVRTPNGGRHALYNLGEPGGNLIPAIAACPRTYLGLDVHLVLLDLHTASLPKNSPNVEGLMRHLLASAGRPAVLAFDFDRPRFVEQLAAEAAAGAFGPGASTMPERRAAAARAWTAGAMTAAEAAAAVSRDLGGANGAGGGGGAAAAPVALERLIGSMAEGARFAQNRRTVDAVHALRRHYALPFFSVPGCLAPLLGDGRVPVARSGGAGRRPAPMGFREYSGDGLHPNQRGAALLGRALVALAARGLAAGGAAGAPPAQARALRPPLHAQRGRVGLACFTLDRAGTRLSHNAQRALPTDAKHRSVIDDRGTFPTLSPETSGWDFVEWENRSRTRYKPGMVATLPGALLEMGLDLSGARQPSVLLQYLRSYEGQGIARVSCAGGCSCGARDVDAHSADERTSTLEDVELPLTPRVTGGGGAEAAHASCLLQLRLLNATSSGEHRFKLARVILQAAAPVRRLRRALRAAGAARRRRSQ